MIPFFKKKFLYIYLKSIFLTFLDTNLIMKFFYSKFVTSLTIGDWKI